MASLLPLQSGVLQGCLGTALIQTLRKSPEEAYEKWGLDFMSIFGAPVSEP